MSATPKDSIKTIYIQVCITLIKYSATCMVIINEQKVKIVGGVFSAQLGMASCYKWDICCVLHASLQPNEMAGKNDRCKRFFLFSQH